VLEIHLYGKLRRFSDQPSPVKESVVFIEMCDDSTIRSVVKKIGIPLSELGGNIFVNGELSGLNRKANDGDRVGIFPDDMQLLYKWYFKKVEN
jgi:molybdopterin converting factor small subunit